MAVARRHRLFIARVLDLPLANDATHAALSPPCKQRVPTSLGRTVRVWSPQSEASNSSYTMC